MLGRVAQNVYNLGSGKETKISQVANMIVKALNLDFELEFDGVVPAGNPLHWQASIAGLQQLNFNPIVFLEKGLETFVHWCRAELVGL